MFKVDDDSVIKIRVHSMVIKIANILLDQVGEFQLGEWTGAFC